MDILILFQQAHNNIPSRVWSESNSSMSNSMVIQDLKITQQSVFMTLSLLTKRSPLLHLTALECLHWALLMVSSCSLVRGRPSWWEV